MNSIDLQIQSAASDGKHAPRDLVQMAKAEQLQIIAITDHDTVEGVEEALKTGGELSVRVIPGIEMSVEERGIHILGYGIDYKNSELLVKLEEFRRGRIEGAKKMVENLKNAGFFAEWEDVLKEAVGGVVARPHIARAILGRTENKEKLGSISTVHDFIETHLFNESPNYVKRSHISVKDAIELIHKSGGVAVWSHPAIHFKPRESRAEGSEQPTDYEEMENFLKDLISWGIDGLEVFNPSHTEDDVEFVHSLAIKYGLLRTAGSDFHEKGVSARSRDGLHAARTVGDYETYGFSVEGIVEKLDDAIGKHR